MMKQYWKVKEAHPDCLLFFRLGDFYEMFHDDAKLGAEELGLTLTTRDRGKPEGERTPMCGVPYHSAQSYIARLIKRGYKVAICEQMEDPATAKGLVDRDVIRIVTPGTAMADEMLDESYLRRLRRRRRGGPGPVRFVHRGVHRRPLPGKGLPHPFAQRPGGLPPQRGHFV